MSTAVLFNPHVYARPGDYDDFYTELSSVRARFADASEAVGVDLAADFFSDDQERMNHHPISRPASIALAAALYDECRAAFGNPDYVAGPSLGSVVAGYAGGYMSFRDAVRMPRHQALAEQIAFAGRDLGVALFYNADLGWLDAAMAEHATEAEPLGACAVLADSQMIVSGAVPALRRLSTEAAGRGTVGVLIPNGPPCHSPLPELAEASERFEREFRYLDATRDPAIPVICNQTSQPLTTRAEMFRSYIDTYTRTVRWEQNLRALADLGVTAVTIVGPGQILRRALEFTAVNFEVRCLVTVDDIQAL